MSTTFAQVHVRSWQVAYRGLLPDEYLDALDPADRAARYTFADSGPDRPYTTVAVEEDRICGFATIGPCRDMDKAESAFGELYAIYVHPACWNIGMGRALIQEARKQLSDRGLVASHLRWKIGDGRRLLALMLRGGCDGFGAGCGGLLLAGVGV